MHAGTSESDAETQPLGRLPKCRLIFAGRRDSGYLNGGLNTAAVRAGLFGASGQSNCPYSRCSPIRV